jgi:hypothetical protein
MHNLQKLDRRRCDRKGAYFRQAEPTGNQQKDGGRDSKPPPL